MFCFLVLILFLCSKTPSSNIQHPKETTLQENFKRKYQLHLKENTSVHTTLQKRIFRRFPWDCKMEKVKPFRALSNAILILSDKLRSNQKINRLERVFPCQKLCHSLCFQKLFSWRNREIQSL